MTKELLNEMVSVVPPDIYYGESEYDIIRVIGEATKMCEQSTHSKEEYCLAGMLSFLLSLAKRYKVNFNSLTIDPTRNRNLTIQCLTMSIIRMGVSGYSFKKRLTIIIGMVCVYCSFKHIDIEKYFFKSLGVK